ncbi:Metallo-hydrolase/oxidoreductase [Aspergillus campestris IBT 28561]|uniref:Metallo-hydrolase/oxidoreductase n=1 Tax=Aspergillus campestris (strain IBT 28561) TaxID=1392248 RepID=A0A2I1CU98_ASPC2|nr:Metallo-hydrolase/oxidoreductase [Aspergillus campestris IBT 28561]PKY01198.1 Metallo-hydrolase/oxidoreductase [Aspergillus campestris IBT 28561]
MEPIVHTVFEPTTGTWQYVVACPSTRAAAIIDPVLDFDLASATITTRSADSLLALVKEHNYTVAYLLETHAHADHLTAAAYLQEKLVASGQPRAPICIGARIRTVQETAAQKYHIPESELAQAFDRLLADDDQLPLGNLSITLLYLPGHTPDHMGYRIQDNIFTGDSIFNPDVGSARCDFPGGDARALFHSMKTLLSLPPHVRLYTGHDYPPAPATEADAKRAPLAYVTVADQKERNKHAKDGSAEEDFVQWRADRDSGLNEPRLLHPALQVNVRGGRMPVGMEMAMTPGGDKVGLRWG